MVECAVPFATQPNPGEPFVSPPHDVVYSAGEQAQFLSRAVRFDTFTVQEFNREFGVLDVSCRVPTPWWVRVYGYALQETTEMGAPSPALPGNIVSGIQSFPGQATIGWGDQSIGPKVIVDVGGGTTLWIPPTRNVSIAALLPEETNRFAVASQQPASPNRIGPAGGEFIHTLFGVSAQPSCCSAGIRRATMTIRRDVPPNDSIFVPLPAAATRLTAYDGPLIDVGPSPAMQYRWVLFDAAGVVRPLADFLPNTPQPVPRGAAVGVQVFGDAVDLARTCLVFELEF